MLATATQRNATRYAFIAAFGGFVFGLDAANLSGAIRYISALFALDSFEVGLVATCSIVGVIIALFFTGWLCERFGRKKILLAIALAYSLSSILSALAVNFEMLVVGRFIGGVAFASITVSAMYIGEIAPADQRGRFVSMSQLLIVLGSLVAFVVNYFLVKALPGSALLTEQNVWRFMLGFELIANIIWVASLLTVPESPRWLMAKGQAENARRIFGQTIPATDIPATIADVEASIAEEARQHPVAQLREFFSRPYGYVIAIGALYAIVQGATGMNAVLFFAPMVFEQIGMSVEDSFFQTIILGATAVLGTIIAILFVEKWGRRFLTLAGLSLIFIAHLSTWHGFDSAKYRIDDAAIAAIAEQGINATKLAPLSGRTYDSDVALKHDLASVYSKQELPLATGPVINSTIDINPVFVLFGIFTFYAAFNLSIGPIMWVIFSEIFPNAVRSVAMPFVALVQTIAGFVISYFFPWQLENLGAASTFLIFAVVAGIGLAIMAFILPETKGKSIEQLERDLVRA